MSLPDAHPTLHEHDGGVCPVTGQTHAFCPPQKGDIRSVCPALNTMANHGYISRDGKKLSAMDIVRGLKSCYGLSTPLAYFLSFVGFLMLKKFTRIDLHDIGKRGVIEHNASLVHHDAPEEQEFAPTEIDPILVEALLSDARPIEAEVETGETFLINAQDVARARIRREKACEPINSVHQEIARGEMAIILGVWEIQQKSKTGIPADWLRRWIGEERLPDNWTPNHVQGLLDVVRRSTSIRQTVARMRQEEANAVKSEKE